MKGENTPPPLDEREWNFQSLKELEELRACQTYEYARESETIRSIVKRFRADPKSFDVGRNPISPYGKPLTIEAIEAAVQMQSFAPARVYGFPDKSFLALSSDERKELLRGTTFESGGEQSYSHHGFQESYHKIATAESRANRDQLLEKGGVYLDWFAFNLNYPIPRILEDVEKWLIETQKKLGPKNRKLPKILSPFLRADQKGKGKKSDIKADLRRLGIARLLKNYKNLKTVRKMLEERKLSQPGTALDALRGACRRRRLSAALQSLSAS